MEVGLLWSAYRCRSQTAHGCCSQKLWYWAYEMVSRGRFSCRLESEGEQAKQQAEEEARALEEEKKRQAELRAQEYQQRQEEVEKRKKLETDAFRPLRDIVLGGDDEKLAGGRINAPANHSTSQSTGHEVP